MDDIYNSSVKIIPSSSTVNEDNDSDLNINFSRKKITKLGKNLRKNLQQDNIIAEKDLHTLQEYRVSHQSALKEVYNALINASIKRDNNNITVYRLKRIDTILNKLIRFPSMDLYTMHDIAGCRSIVQSEGQIRAIVKELTQNPDFEIPENGHYDYIKSPKDDGYRSYHLKVISKKHNRTVEVQLRTRALHYWATFVEITDLLHGVKLKEGEKHEDLSYFHKLLSIDKKELTTIQSRELLDIEMKYNIMSTLANILNSKYFESMKRWGDNLIESKEKYILLVLDEHLQPNFKMYNNFEQAEEEYLRAFSKNEPNMVLIHTNDISFPKVAQAYSNYILTSHPTVKYYIEIMQDYLINGLAIYSKEDMSEYIDQHQKIANAILESFRNEKNTMFQYIASESDQSQHLSDTKKAHIKICQADFIKRMDNHERLYNNFTKELEKFTSNNEGDANATNLMPVQETAIKENIFTRIFKYILKK